MSEMKRCFCCGSGLLEQCVSPVYSGAGLLVLLACLLLSGCDGEEPQTYKPSFSRKPPRAVVEYVFGVHPLHNPKRLHEIFSPIADYLSEQIPGARFRVEASRNYAAYEEKLYGGNFHFALPNPYQTVNSLKYGYTVFGKMADDDNFRGIILVRKDSNIRNVSDLKGKAVSFPAPTALAATMMPLFFMQNNGLDVMNDIKIQYVGSQESSIMNVFVGNTAAGSTWPPPWRALSKERPELAEALEIKWSTDSLPNNGLVARDGVPGEVVEKVAELLFSLHEHERGRKWLERMELSSFEKATNETYAPVREFLKKFNDTVHPIDY